MKKILVLLSLTGSLVISSFAHAAPGNQVAFDALMDEFGVLTSYRAVAAAAPLGLLGFDVSLEATSGTYDGNSVVLPKIKFQKGLFAGLDLAGYYSTFSVPVDNAATTAYGAALTYAIWEGGAAKPALNVRGSYTNTNVAGIIRATTIGVDTSISKGFGPITPYAGIGMVNLSGIDSTGTYSNYSATKSRYFYGFSLDLAILNFTFEADTTGGVNSISLKTGIRIGD